MVQLNNILKMFDSAQNEYLQMRDEEDDAIHGSKILITGFMNSSTKSTLGRGK